MLLRIACWIVRDIQQRAPLTVNFKVNRIGPFILHQLLNCQDKLKKSDNLALKIEKRAIILGGYVIFAVRQVGIY